MILVQIAIPSHIDLAETPALPRISVTTGAETLK